MLLQNSFLVEFTLAGVMYIKPFVRKTEIALLIEASLSYWFYQEVIQIVLYLAK